MIKLIKGDCSQELKKIKNNTVDLAIIDPPYLMDYGGNKGCFKNKMKKYDNNIRNKIDLNFNFDVFDEIVRVLKKINIYIFCSKKQIPLLFDKFLKDYKIEIFDLITWCKTNPTPFVNNTYLSDTEYILYFREKGIKLYGGYETKSRYYISKKEEGYDDVIKKDIHPTVKPLKMIKNFIINSSKENDTVLDCFMGSDTTGIASKKLNRNFIGIEINDKYFENAKNRIYETEQEEKQLTLYDYIINNN